MIQKPSKPARNPEEGGSWAILGGLFDPIHNGHLTLARDLDKALDTDGIILVPSFSPPHRNNISNASFDDRVAMAQLAIAEDDRFVLSDIESEMEEPGYTLNVVRALKAKYTSASFCFIMGADNIDDMRNWYKPEEILNEVDVIAGARPGYYPENPDEFPANRIKLVQTGLVDVSSSDLRKRIREGIDESELAGQIPPEVARYIVEKDLYR